MLERGPLAHPGGEEMGEDMTVSIIGGGQWTMVVGPGADAVALHLPTDERFRYPDGPRVFEPNTVWTGDELIVWGGAGNSTDDERVTNLIWTPPNPAKRSGR